MQQKNYFVTDNLRLVMAKNALTCLTSLARIFQVLKRCWGGNGFCSSHHVYKYILFDIYNHFYTCFKFYFNIFHCHFQKLCLSLSFSILMVGLLLYIRISKIFNFQFTTPHHTLTPHRFFPSQIVE